MIVLDRTSFDKGIKFAGDIIDCKLADMVTYNPMLVGLMNEVTHILHAELARIREGEQLQWGGEEISFLKGSRK